MVSALRTPTIAVRCAVFVAAVAGTPALADCDDLDTAQLAASEQTRAVTAEDLARLRDIGTVGVTHVGAATPLALSPDERRIAFVLTRGNPDGNTMCHGLFVLDLEQAGPPVMVDHGGEPILAEWPYRGLSVVVGAVDPPPPRWSPDGRTLAYLRRDNGVTQLWVADTAEGGARAITSGGGDVVNFAWADDGRTIVFARRESAAERQAAQAAEAAGGYLYDDRFVPARGHGLQPTAERPTKRFFVEVQSGDEPAALPVEVARFTDRDRSPVGIATDPARPLAPPRPRFEAAGSDPRVCGSDACTQAVAVFEDADPGSLLYLRRQGFASEELGFYRWSPERGEPHELWRTRQTLFGCVRAARSLICLAESPRTPRHLVAVDIETGASRTVYDPNPEFARLALSQVERLHWRNDRGFEARGDLVVPSGRRPASGWPMVVVQYNSNGFLRGGTGDEYPIFALAARGIAVLSLEQPGIVARIEPDLPDWEAINAYNARDWAERRSLLSSLRTGVAMAAERGIADPDRIGLTGLSDGATTVAFALINAGPFAAASISSCCTEPESLGMLGGPGYAAERLRLGYPPLGSDDREFWAPMSLARNAGAIDTPLLMQLSDDEYLLGLPSYTALKQRGKPVEMYVFPGEHHIKWQPAHRLAVYERNLDWFDFWLRGVEDPDPAKARQYARWRMLRSLD